MTKFLNHAHPVVDEISLTQMGIIASSAVKFDDLETPGAHFIGRSGLHVSEELMDEIHQLCIQVEYLQSWWKAHEPLISAVKGGG